MAAGPTASDGGSSSSYSSFPDTTAFSLLARRALTDALDRIAGAKTLVLDAVLAGPLGLVAEMSVLRDHGVDKIFWLEPGALSQVQKHIVYLCRPEINLMRIIANQIKAAPTALNHTYNIMLTPRVTSVCASILEELGVLGSIELHEFPMTLIPLERDVLSMELGAQAYKDIFLDSNFDAIYEMGRALITLQRAFGLIPRIYGKGDAARRLADLMVRLRKESSPTPSMSPSTNYGQIDSIVLLDRQVDMVTPLCAQLTYEGLVDEIVGIKNCFVEVDANVTNPAPPTPSSSSATHFGATGPPRRKRHLLSTLHAASVHTSTQQGNSGSESLFAEIRDRNFAVVGIILNRTAKRINADYEGRHAAQTVGQMREFVGKLSSLQAEHQALRLHTALTEQIMGITGSDEFNRALEIQQNLVAGLELGTQETSLHDFINMEANVYTVLRLLCLLCLVSNGIKSKSLEDFKREILQTYGYKYLPLLISLADLNMLFKSTGTKAPFAIARKPLRLIVDDVDEAAPDDVAFVYSGYAPISVRLVQHVLGLGNTSGGFISGLPGVGGSREKSGASLNGWKGLQEVMRTLPGTVFEDTQQPDGESKPKHSYTPDHLPVTVVCFIGGCTYTEIAALRFTSQRLSSRKLLIVTTGILNGNTIMDSLGPPRTSSP